MKAKMNIGKVLLSVAIAMAMLIPALPANAIPPDDYSIKYSEIDVLPPTPPTPPDAPVVVFTDGFAVWPGPWIILDLNVDAIIWYQGLVSSDGDGFCAEFMTNPGGDLDQIMIPVDLSAYVPGPCWTATATLEFDYMGDSTTMFYYPDGVTMTPLPPAPVWTHVGPVTVPVGGIVNIIFENNNPLLEAGRFMYIDNVTVIADQGPTGDIVINGILNMTNGGRYNTLPKVIEVSVTNTGLEPAEMVDFHFQVYQEVPYEPEIYHCWDMENCILNTWYAIDGNGDGVTWYYTEKRSHSPTHSYHSQPDWLDTYEAFSFDSLLLQDPYTLPTEMDGKTIQSMWLTFWHYLEGEYGYDYGILTITNLNDLTTLGDYYLDNTDGWEQVEFSIPPSWFGDDIMINFTWVADGYMNYEGWYIDDICIEVSFTSEQPLVDQGYKYVDIILPGETLVFQFPLTYEFEEGYYYLQVYSDYVDCNPDELYPFYADEINWTIWFGDTCDALIDDVYVAGSEFEMPDTSTVPGEDEITIPIDVTVCNNGTLTKDVPVQVSVNRLVTETIWYNDAESVPDPMPDDGTDGYLSGDFGSAPSGTTWHVTDSDFYSPYHAFACANPATGYYTAGHVAYWSPLEDQIDWNAYLADPNFDVVWTMKWNMNPALLNPTTGMDNMRMWVHCGNYIVTLSSSRAMLRAGTNTQLTWTEVSSFDWLGNYVAGWTDGTPDYPVTLVGFFKAITELGYGFTWPDDFHGFGWKIDGTAYNVDTIGYGGGSWSGVLIDDISIGTSYAGDPVWETMYTAEDLLPGDCETFTVNWTTTEYCDYIAVAEVMLDCDMDETNNIGQSDPFRIYEQIYWNETEGWDVDDNTYGLDDDWHIIEECSYCPVDHFWWNGIIDADDGTAHYDDNVNDVLEMVPYETDDNELFVDVENGTMDFTTIGFYNLTFDMWADLELWFDYVILEISNDSGHNWYPVDEFTGYYDPWFTYGPLVLYDPYGTGICQNPNGLPDLWAPWPVPAIGATDEMMLRFNMISDGGTYLKGFMLDDVLLTYSDGVGGGDIELFFDDMESGEAKWRHMAEYTGSLWHEEAGGVLADFDTYYSWYNLYDIADGWFYYDETDYGFYRNNMDDKLIVYFDLTKAYQAFLTWEQNYDFNGMYPEDYGVVEIWTGTEWKALFIVQGGTSATWVPMELDISEYCDHTGLTMVRFRMISDSSLVGAGWQLRNFSINGKVDFKNPTVAGALSPASPNGNFGWYTSPVTVTLTATDNVKVEAIYYSIDGGAWKLYTAPITINIDGEHTVDFYSVDEVGNVSPTGTLAFKIDATRPTVSISAPAAGYIYLFGRQLFANPLGGTVIIGGIDFTATASDAMSGLRYVSFAVDGMTYEKVSSPYTIYWHKFDLLPASYTLTVSAYDIAGNKATDATLTFRHWL